MVSASGIPPPHVCYLCKRKFPGDDLLKRHERLSDLHKQNLERQDDLVQQRKEDIRGAVSSLRQQIHQLDMELADQVLPNEKNQQRKTTLEMQMRQLLGEYGQAQEMAEDFRAMKGPGGLGHNKAPRTAFGRPACAREVTVAKLKLEAGVACWQGNKEVQEDRYMLNMDLVSPEGISIAGFCVLDGHSGSLCVDQMVERLPANLQKCLSAKPSLTEELLAQAVHEACILTDDEFLHRARQHEVLDGSTMILGLVYPEGNRSRLLIANVGDSRAVLCRAGAVGTDGEPRLQAIRLSDDHKPGRPDEQSRVEAKGGVVDLQGVWRVFTPGPSTFGGRMIQRWGLAVSRAFGDLLLKEPERYGCSSVAPGGLIISDPEIRVVDLVAAEDRFVIIACDGVWDVLSDDDAVACCAQQVGAEPAAAALLRQSYAAGTDDNLTAMVITWSPAEGQ